MKLHPPPGAVVLALVVASAAWHAPVKLLPTARAAQAPVSAPARPVDSLPPALGCLIEPDASADVAAAAPGVLAKVVVERGDHVKRGDVLAVLDQEIERAALEASRERARTRAEIAAAEATRAMARKKTERFAALHELSYGAKLELELAKGELEVAEHRLRQARDAHRIAERDYEVSEQRLAQRSIRSPIDGVVADRYLNPGERADGRPIVRVIRLDQLRAEVVVPAQRFGQIRKGMVGTLTPEVAGAASMQASVVQVDPFVDAASGTFRARLAIANRDLAIPAGVRCDVRFANGS